MYLYNTVERSSSHQPDFSDTLLKYRFKRSAESCYSRARSYLWTNLRDTEFLKSYYRGSQLIADTLEVVIARLAATTDLDTTKLNVAQMFPLVVEEVAVAGTDFPRRLRRFSELLRQCMDSLDDDDDED